MPAVIASPVAKKRVDLDQAFLLYLKHENFHEVARILGCSAQNVQKRLRRYRGFQAAYSQLEQVKTTRLDVMVAAEARLIRSLVDEVAIEKAPLAARATTFGILNERRRLEEGKSTANVLHGAIVRIQREALDLTMKAISGPAVDGEEATAHKPHTTRRKVRAKS